MMMSGPVYSDARILLFGDSKILACRSVDALLSPYDRKTSDLTGRLDSSS